MLHISGTISVNIFAIEYTKNGGIITLNNVPTDSVFNIKGKHSIVTHETVFLINEESGGEHIRQYFGKVVEVLDYQISRDLKHIDVLKFRYVHENLMNRPDDISEDRIELLLPPLIDVVNYGTCLCKVYGVKIPKVDQNRLSEMLDNANKNPVSFNGTIYRRIEGLYLHYLDTCRYDMDIIRYAVSLIVPYSSIPVYSKTDYANCRELIIKTRGTI